MRTIAGIVIMVALVLGCGDKDTPNFESDVGETGVAAEVVELRGEACTPQCEGRDSGPDGCGGRAVCVPREMCAWSPAEVLHSAALQAARKTTSRRNVETMTAEEVAGNARPDLSA